MSEVAKFLHRIQVSFTPVTHRAVYTVEESLGEFEEKTPVKNLFIQDDKGKRQYLVVMPGMKRLDLKSLAAKLGEKKLRFCSEKKLLTMLGVTPGSVSLFSLLHDNSHHVKLLFDKELLTSSELGFHPNINTATYFIQTKDLVTIFEALHQDYEVIEI